ncbi:MAG: hypothetical protein U0325_13070 [Polyangiales bacterium]
MRAHPATPEQPPRATRRRRRHRRRNGGRMERGVAMIMVLAAISLLYVMAEQIRDEVLTYSLAASVGRDQLIAEYQARSAVNLARVLLHAEPTLRRAITPVLTPFMAMMGRGFAAPPQIPIWEQADLILGPFRSREGAQMLSELARLDSGGKNLGGLTGLSPVVICDEDAKINVNSAVRSSVQQILLGRQLAGLGATPGSSPTSRSATPTGSSPTCRPSSPTWSTTSTSTRPRSTPRASSRPTPRPRTTRPRTASSRSSARPTAGATRPRFGAGDADVPRPLGDDDLLNAMVDLDPSDPRRRTLTVWGQGAVNGNTANAQTLQAPSCAPTRPDALPCTDPAQARRTSSPPSPWCSRHAATGIPLFTRAELRGDDPGCPPMGPDAQTLGLQTACGAQRGGAGAFDHHREQGLLGDGRGQRGRGARAAPRGRYAQPALPRPSSARRG